MRPILRLWDGYPHTNPEYKDNVKDLQKLLDIHYDGYFGPQTERAVIAFQKERSLNPDGVVGKGTWGALLGHVINVTSSTIYVRNTNFLLRCNTFFQDYKEFVEEGCNKYDLPVSVIFGIGVRESHWGDLLRPRGPDGTGDWIKRPTTRPWRSGVFPPDGGGYGRGLMQIDFDAHKFARGNDWKDPRLNILYGCKVLYTTTRYLGNLRAGIAGYNCGAGNVKRALRRGYSVDHYTHGRDYSEMVMNYKGWYESYVQASS